MDKHLDAGTLSDYAEGLLEARARTVADGHLADCADCRRELAAVQAYFRDLSGLEPVRAPADFLAKVRARLPRPSPWRRAWAAITTPMRAIPLTVAAGLIIGVTAITVYIKEGGPESRATLAAPKPMPVPSIVSALPSEEKDVAAEKASPPAPATDDRDALAANSQPVPHARIRNAPSPKTTVVRPLGAEPHAIAPKASYGAAAPSSSNLAAAEARKEASAPQPEAADARSPSAPAPMASPEPSPTAPGGAETEAAAAPAAKRKAEAGRGSAGAMDKLVPAPIALPGYVLSLRNAGDTAAVLSGLRSMGIEAALESTCVNGSVYRLLVPAAMVRELGPYLARHGTSRAEGPQPEAASGTRIPMRLRLIITTP